MCSCTVLAEAANGAYLYLTPSALLGAARDEGGCSSSDLSVAVYLASARTPTGYSYTSVGRGDLCRQVQQCGCILCI
eukprot:6214649-Pleurochrysis_carterae.AAC.6